MSCINPVTITQKNSRFIHNFEVPCGHCLNCLIKKQSQLTFLAQRELLDRYKNNQSASFVTLTYDDNHLPFNDNGFVTLRKRDVQNFLKNVRRNMQYHNVSKSFKVLYCGEYGDGSHSSSKTGVSTCRPHYHIAFIGLSPEEIKIFTRKLWKNGICDVGPLTSGGLRYICKYMTKACPDKEVKAIREAAEVENPFICHSIGLGKSWIERNMKKIVDDEFTFNLNGKRYMFPKYVIQFVSNHTGINYQPFVTKFLYNERLPLAKAKNQTYSQYDFEDSFIKYKYKVAALRSQGKPINDITLNKKWCKPHSSHDRSLVELASKLGKSENKFKDIKKSIPIKQKWDKKNNCWTNGVDWDLYLYGDVVPF